jgi:single-stranded-DNA-specific exonuclease
MWRRFKLCQGLNTIYKIPEAELFELTDLLAISIAADIVSMTGENRVLAKMGLKTLRKTRNLGLRLLIPEDKLSHFEISNIVFEIAPKINAAGRISHGKAVELMVSDNLKHANQIVNDIMNLNDERRELDMNSTLSALNQIIESQQETKHTTIVYHPEWNKGVIGIVASRLIETYYKPTLVFTDGNNGKWWLPQDLFLILMYMKRLICVRNISLNSEDIMQQQDFQWRKKNLKL